MIRALRLILFFVLGLSLGAVSALAFAVPGVANSTGAWRNVGTTPSWSGGSGGSVGGVASTIETVRVGGTYIPVPVTGTINGGAVAQTMISALKMTPTAMLGGALLQWLLNQGMEWIDGEWKKLQPPTNEAPSGGSCAWQIGGYCGDTPKEACDKWWIQNGGWNGECVETGTVPYGGYYAVDFRAEDTYGHWANPRVYPQTASCPVGSTWNSSLAMCEIPGGYQPVGQSDWDQVAGVTPPDDVMNDICGRLFALDGIGCRVTNLGTKTAVAPLSDSYTDGTGTNWQQTGKWTPQPTASNPLAGEITVVKSAVSDVGTKTNPDGSQTTTTVDPNTGKITETTTLPDGTVKQTVTNPDTGTKTTTTTTPSGETESKTETPDKDFCVQHPDSLACSEYGEVVDQDLEIDERNITITPDTGFGPLDGTCPADKVSVLRNGVEARFSFQPVCTMATTFRPIVIGLAWVSAGLLMFGLGRRGD